MTPDGSNVTAFAKEVLSGIQEKNVTFMASSIAYQAFVSLIPLLVLVFFLVAVVGDEGLANEVSRATEGMLPNAGQDVLEESIEGQAPSGSIGASLIGLVTLLWGSLKIFRGLDTAFSEIYETTAENSFVDSLRDGLVVFVAILAALVAAGGATALFALLPSSTLIGLLNPLVLLGGLTVAFLPMFYFFPDADLTVREVIPGTVVAAVGWAALQPLFQVYVALAGSSESSGAIGAILLLLTWLYFGGLVLLVGGVVNATYGNHLHLEESGEGRQTPSGGGAPSTLAAGDLRERIEDLDRRAERLERERDLLRNDLGAQRTRRYRLEDRTDRLEERNRELERENRRLRRQLELRREPAWKEYLRRAAGPIGSVGVGTVRSDEDR
ncbi:YihY/virulence factor BrkB family protein [Natrialbaceae archaeon GCM10025810]|uniref:YihY/virulence factor BrkB family protein n=1 Tax=Halovalidus salilacus TaxID=3075124 RepID=UPI0036119389